MATIIPFDQLAPMLRVIPSLPRPVLARLTERLLERLDELDGDPDLEEDDHPGDPLDIHGEHPTDDGQTMLPTKPIYGEDQTLGPINEQDATRAFYRQELEL